MSYFAGSNERPSGILLPPVALSPLSIRDFQVARETRGVDEFGPVMSGGGPVERRFPDLPITGQG